VGYGRRKKGISAGLVMWVLGILMFLTALAGGMLAFWIVPKTQEITLEAGTMPSLEAGDYFDGTQMAVSRIVLEKGIDDITRVGEEKLVFSYLHFGEYSVRVHIVDTTPPKFETTREEIGLEPGEVLEADSLVTGASDNAAGSLSVEFADGKPEHIYDTFGCFDDMICVRDANGNISRKPVTVWVAEAPQITAPGVYYVMQSDEDYSEEEFLREVSVTDEQDGEAIRDSLVMKRGSLDTGREGDYEIEFEACNSYHVRDSVVVEVHVVPENRLTSVLMSDKEALLDGKVLTKDTGAEAERLKESDIVRAEQDVQPTLVSIHFTLKNGYAYGNGFVIDMTEDAVYIASNYHVLAPFEKEQAVLTFYPGYHTSAYTFLGGNEEKDVAFVRIDKADLPQEVWDYLKEPAISLARAMTIQEGEELFRTSLFVNKPTHTEEGYFSAYESRIFNGSTFTTFSVKIEQGDSGSAVFDSHGYLISMCAGVSHEEKEDQMCGVQLKWILAEYERCSGNKIYGF